ncbi:MAG: YbhB/YbcL family Raf kinase inhibitor-like protein [Candidatus Hydrogenedentota bacterium]|nr:MAG: YbhB/YbcL family Raf kinase inhibitor-like protein [Candidatus Hydrogenedentota bacterium]
MACGAGSSGKPFRYTPLPRSPFPEAPKTIEITSSAFAYGEEIPKRYTCQGVDISPPLSWDSVPEKAVTLMLVVEDPDAPDPAAPRMTWDHWIVYDIPASETGLIEAVSEGKAFPPGTQLGLNSWKRHNWGGPCPPRGRHRYLFRIFALDTRLGPSPSRRGPTKKQLYARAKGHVLAQGLLVGTYAKK